MHKAVKVLLEQRKEILVPECYVRLSTRFVTDGVFGYGASDWRAEYSSIEAYDEHHPETGVGFVPARLVHFDDVRSEQWEGSFRPDSVGFVRGVPLFIEVAVTHFVDADKERKLRARGVSALELDFSGEEKSLWTWEALERRLFVETEGKAWIINRKAEAIATADHADRVRRMAGFLAQQERRRIRQQQKNEENKQYEVTHLLRFDTSGYFSSCRVLLSPACVSTNLEHVSDWALKRRFVLKVEQLGGIYHPGRRNYEFPPSKERFLAIAVEFYNLFGSTPRSGGLKAPDEDRETMEKALGSGIRRWP